jgi:hypothetical protein
MEYFLETSNRLYTSHLTRPRTRTIHSETATGWSKKILCTWRLYCNHRVQRDFLTTLYISPKKEYAFSRAKSSGRDALINLQGSTSASCVLTFLWLTLLTIDKIQYTWRWDYHECEQPAQIHILTRVLNSVPPGTTIYNSFPTGTMPHTTIWQT